MFKIKHERTADCVVAGYRWHKAGGVVGSLLLGLHDESGALQHVGVAASFPMQRRAQLVEELARRGVVPMDGSVLRRLDQKMTTAFHGVLDMATSRDVHMRDAAYMVAIDRVVKAMDLRGWL